MGTSVYQKTSFFGNILSCMEEIFNRNGWKIQVLGSFKMYLQQYIISSKAERYREIDIILDQNQGKFQDIKLMTSQSLIQIFYICKYV